ncbi:MAG TPA: hypothetical protein VM204_03425, partial [Gaiellaceae bacterium]|nr:hypothetical protein [Gaiellaceae bacterium]
PAPRQATPPAPAPAPDAAAPRYPVGRACSKPEAIAAEKKTLPPTAAWEPLDAPKERLSLRVPPGVFQVKRGEDGLELRSSLAARGLGPDGNRERHFAIRLQRVPRGVDELLADTAKGSPLGGLYVEGAFPRRTTASFVPQHDETLAPGSAERATVAGRPAWVWLNGVEGYNSDYVLVELGPKDTLLVVADWNSSIMMGQPECWQRAVIGGVVESVVVDPPK